MAFTVSGLEPEVIDYIAELRHEAAQNRAQRNGARREAARLRADVKELRSELEALRAAAGE